MKMLEFLQDESGRLSSMRLMSILLVLSGIFAAFFRYDPAIYGTLIGSGISGKCLQNFTEAR